MTLNKKADREAEGEIMSDVQYAPKAVGGRRECMGAKRAGYEGRGGSGE